MAPLAPPPGYAYDAAETAILKKPSNTNESLKDQFTSLLRSAKSFQSGFEFGCSSDSDVDTSFGIDEGKERPKFSRRKKCKWP